ncbi:MAG: GNAT family N-acetyltransferase [Acidimicrobiia bacterium]
MNDYFPFSEHVEYRQYKRSDKEQVRLLHEIALKATDAYAKPGVWDSDLDDIEKHYIDNGGEFIVGLIKNEVVAMGAYKPVSESAAEIKRMRVRPDLQGKGIGKILLTMLEESIENKGYLRIVLDTTVNQKAARHLYETNGYKEVRREIEGWPLEMIYYQKDLISCY